MVRHFCGISRLLIVITVSIVISAEVLAADGIGIADPNTVKNNLIAGLRKDAEQGNEKAQYLLGCCYNGDYGFPKDPAEASKWWRKAAAKGDADAQYCLGLSYYLGLGLPKNATEAAKWWRKAGDQDNADAQYFLGLSYCAGLGVPKNTALAIYWLHRSANLGNQAALNILRKIGLSPG